MRSFSVAALSVFLVVTACQHSESTSQADTVEDDVLMIINAEPILESQFEQFLRFAGDTVDGARIDRKTRLALFGEYVRRRLLLQEAARAGIQIERLEVEAYAAEWIGDQVVSPGLYDHIREFLMIQRLLHQEVASKIEVNLPELRNYYQSNIDQYMADDQVHVLEILVAERQQALEIRGQLKDGDVRSFRELARLHSLGVTADAGGDLGLFERGDLPMQFEEVIFALNPGEISAVFQSQKGHHIFLVEERIPGHLQKFYEVQDQVFGTVMADKERAAIQEFMNQIIESASIKVYDERLNFQTRLSEDLSWLMQ